MANTDIDEEQAKVQIGVCEVELVEAECDGIQTRDAEPTLRIARSFLKAGDFEKAFLFAVRARRMAVESRLNKDAPLSRAKR